jgi:hypothetical protein
MQVNTLYQTIDYTTCYACKLKICLKCHRPAYDTLTCAGSIQIPPKGQNIETFNDMIKKGFKLCPHCYQWIEKTSGCNFITCGSKSCNGKKYFCFQCGGKLGSTVIILDHLRANQLILLIH